MLNTPIGQAYARLSPGTKICLAGGDESDLEALYERLSLAGLSPVRIIDQGHIEPPHFDGSEILTALGVGPLSRAEAPRALRRLMLWDP